jgi:hypothetical protein
LVKSVITPSTLKETIMPTYTEYLAYAKRKGFQPMQATTFYAVIKAGINPIALAANRKAI